MSSEREDKLQALLDMKRARVEQLERKVALAIHVLAQIHNDGSADAGIEEMCAFAIDELASDEASPNFTLVNMDKT